jgi:hypothetical protein
MNFSNFYIKEFVAIPTKGEEEVTVGARKYYKSKKLNEKVKKVIEKYADKDVSQVLAKSIDKELIIPLYIDTNIPQNILNSIRNKYRYHSRGLACLLDRRGYIFINPKFLYVNSRDVYGTLIHELMHIASAKYPSKVLSIHYDKLETFYKTFFSEITPLMLNKNCIKSKDIEYFIKNLFANFTFRNYSKIKNIDDSSFTKKIVDIYDVFLRNTGESCNLSNNEKYNETCKIFKKFIESFIIKFYITKQIYNYGKIAYEKALKIRAKTFTQELWLPSEVISVFAGVYPNHPDIKKTLLLFKI